jgi:hypothetical protein
MTNKLHKAFPTIVDNSCLEVIERSSFSIIDEEKRCRIVDEGQFKVSNPHQKSIHFLAVDSCTFLDSDDTRCDCILFNEKTFCFIELKSCKSKNESNHRKKAKAQLKATIKEFKSRLSFTQALEAYICITCIPVGKSPRAANQEAIVEFEEVFDTKLSYGCEKDFSDPL